MNMGDRMMVKTPYAPDSSDAFGILASVLRLRSLNKRVSGSGFQPSPKSPSATSDTRRTLGDISLGGLKYSKREDEK